MYTLQELREKEGLSQSELARRLGIERMTYVSWEKGKNKISEDNKEKVADFYNLTTSEINFNLMTTQIAIKEEIEDPFEEEDTDKYGFTSRRIIASPERIEESIRKDLGSLKTTFFNIGYKLHLVDHYNLLGKLGYQSIEEYAKDKFNIGRSSTFAYIKVYKMIRSANGREIEDKYKKYNYSQLEAMSTVDRYTSLGHNLLDVVKPDTDRDDIRKYIKAYVLADKKSDFPSIMDWKTVQDGIDYLESENNKKEISKNDDIPEGQLIVNDNSEIETYEPKKDEQTYSYNVESNTLDETEDVEPCEVFKDNPQKIMDLGSINNVEDFNVYEKVRLKLNKIFSEYMYDNDYTIRDRCDREYPVCNLVNTFSYMVCNSFNIKLKEEV